MSDRHWHNVYPGKLQNGSPASSFAQDAAEVANALEAQLAEALSQRQAAVEEAERLRDERDKARDGLLTGPLRSMVNQGMLDELQDVYAELAAANHDAKEGWKAYAQAMTAAKLPPTGYRWLAIEEANRPMQRRHEDRLASQPPAEAGG